MFLAAFIICAVLGVSSGGTVEETVAFTAGYDGDRELREGQTFVFNKVIINNGSGYNNKTGVFIAPKSGIYLFQFYALTKKTNSIWLSLYHNNDYVISAFARQHVDYDSAGNSAILELKKSDRVYVKARGKVSVYGRPDDIYTTFSGYSIGLRTGAEFV